jgi:IS5 family transposase
MQTSQTNLRPMETDARARRYSALMRAHALIDWEGLRVRIVELYRREVSREAGQKPIDALVMFKAVLLGQWHSLSDPKLEEALRMRSDFMHFCGLSASDDLPDEVMLRRFRNRLITSGRLAGLLAGVNTLLRRHGLLVKDHSAMTDATLVQSAAYLKPEVIFKPDSANRPRIKKGGVTGRTAVISPTLASCAEAQSIDPDSTWIKRDTLKFQYGRATPEKQLVS